MELSRQEYWSELPLLSPGDLPNPGNGEYQADEQAGKTKSLAIGDSALNL